MTYGRSRKATCTTALRPMTNQPMKPHGLVRITLRLMEAKEAEQDPIIEYLLQSCYIRCSSNKDADGVIADRVGGKGAWS